MLPVTPTKEGNLKALFLRKLTGTKMLKSQHLVILIITKNRLESTF